MSPADVRQDSAPKGKIRVGVGGWSYEPWRGLFYPTGAPHERELEYASRRLTTIEINATFYRTQNRETFLRWREATPDDFVFSVKAPRVVTHRRVLAEAAGSLERFFASGVVELGGKLGPIVWQFPPTKMFVEDDFATFLQLLPARHEGVALRHAIELRHESFACAAAIGLAHDHGAAIVFEGDSKFPEIGEVTAPFVYLRLMGSKATPKQGYSNAALDLWADRAMHLARGEAPDGFAPLVGSARRRAHDVYVYFIAGHKANNPLAAQALMKRLS